MRQKKERGKKMNDFYKGKPLPFIIAEIGINHNGDLEIAKRLIDMAKDCGCDAVKFQKRDINTVYTQEFLDSPRKSPWGTTQRQQKEGLEFGFSEYKQIDDYCREKGIPWFASAWDLKSQDFLVLFDLPYNKIASAMLTHLELVATVAREGKPTFISTGMSSWEQIDTVVSIFSALSCPFTLMHTVSAYPIRDIDCNIDMIRTLKDRYGFPVGYSGHETGLLPSVLAAALGAMAIERHITLDRCLYGSDQAASLEKHGLELLVRDTRIVRSTIGDGVKTVLEAERATERSLRYWREA
jgi:N-acetylneuraminate synthase